jgi:hypothetical protein
MDPHDLEKEKVLPDTVVPLRGGPEERPLLNQLGRSLVKEAFQSKLLALPLNKPE